MVNQNSALSRSIAEYYALKRHIPTDNLCRLNLPLGEEISRTEYDSLIAIPLAAYLVAHRLQDSTLYLITTSEVPLRIRGTIEGTGSDTASVDSELTLVYQDLRGNQHSRLAYVPNPFFNQGKAKFSHPQYPLYLVTRLTGYDFQDVRAIIDRSLAARNKGKFVIDLKAPSSAEGNEWLRAAAAVLPKSRVVLDDSSRVIQNQADVIAYAGWGSNDPERHFRNLSFRWLPGAIATEFVSTNARTFRRPPPQWTLGTWADPTTWFAGSPQTMAADYIKEGATGMSGHVAEPYLALTPRPDILLPAYYQGRNLAESYYLAIPGLSWMNIVIGDPLCSLGTPK